MSGRRGSARIERLPSARGPNSTRPWYQPTMPPSASASAVRAMSFVGRAAPRTATPAASSAAACARRRYSGPQYAWSITNERGAPSFVMLHVVRGADARAAVVGGRLDVEVGERRLVEDLAVHDAVQSDAAGQAERVDARLGVQVAQHAEHDLLEPALQRAAMFWWRSSSGSVRRASGAEQRLHAGPHSGGSSGEPPSHVIAAPSMWWRKSSRFRS